MFRFKGISAGRPAFLDLFGWQIHQLRDVLSGFPFFIGFQPSFWCRILQDKPITDVVSLSHCDLHPMIFVGHFIGPIGPPNWWISAPRPGLSSCQVLELINKRFALMDGRAMQQQLELFKAPGSKSMAITRFFREAIYIRMYIYNIHSIYMPTKLHLAPHV